MKQAFIQSLKNGQIPFSENEAALAKLSDKVFEPFNADLVTLEQHQHRWNETYFNAKTTDLDFNFSKVLIQHLIQVKKHIQEQKKGVETVTKAVVTQAYPEGNSKQEIIVPIKPQAVEKAPNFAKPELLNFKPNERLMSFLQSGDVSKVRSYLMSMLNNRRLSLEELFKSIWYVNEHKSEVFESEETTAFVQAIHNDENSWNIEYFNLQQVYLNKNFSLARILHLANVRETLMKRGDRNFQQIKVEKESETVKAQTQANTAQNRASSTTSQSASYSQSSNQNGNTTSSKPAEDNNGFMKTIMMVGGAILALAVTLFAIFK